jgi:NAD(P)-dependent dehydrogenase (short-subunit alcohol dehydrogenase family)
MVARLTVLVTGAASGIGNASALQLLAAGHEVVGVDLDAQAVRASLKSSREELEPVSADVSREEDCRVAADRAISRFGKIDAVLHWAAKHSRTYWSELTAEEFNHLLAVNTTGSFLIAQAAARHMLPRKSGAIVLASSTSVIAGTTGGPAGSGGPAYVASKAPIIGLVRSLARALGPSGIRVNGVSPGVTETPMIAAYSAENRAIQQGRVPLRRLAQADEIASVGAFLISDDARYINGETIIVDGGAAFG